MVRNCQTRSSGRSLRRAEQLGAFIMLHPNGFTQGERLTHFYFNNVLGNPLETTLALHNLIFTGTLARFPDLKLMAVHGGGYLPAYSGRIDHAWGARQDSHGDLPLPPTTYLRQVYLDTVVFSYHQLAYLLDVFGPDRILMGTDYPLTWPNSIRSAISPGSTAWTKRHWRNWLAAMRSGYSIVRSACIVWRSSVHERPLLAQSGRSRACPLLVAERTCHTRWSRSPSDPTETLTRNMLRRGAGSIRHIVGIGPLGLPGLFG